MTGSHPHESMSPSHSDHGEHPSAREGLFHSIGSMLFRPLSWVSSPRRVPSPPTNHRSATHVRNAGQTPASHTASSASTTDKGTSTLSLAASKPFRGTHTLPSSLRVPPVSKFASPRSKWASLNLATSPSRSFATQSDEATVPNNPSAHSISSSSLVSVLGKRNPSTHEAEAQHDEVATEFSSSRKRRMVWDPEMGFVDVEDLAARRPPPPPPQNEAERILRALESMRTPLGDARRERIIRSQSRPSWSLTAPIPVPLPTPERESVMAPSRLHSPAFRSIAPHSRSLRRSQLLRQSQVGLQSTMRSKLRQSMPFYDTQRDSLDEQRVEEDLKVAEPEPPTSRTTKRRASKAKLSSKSSRAKLVKTDKEVVEKPSQGLDMEPEANPESKGAASDASVPKTQPSDQADTSIARKRATFEVRPDNEPIPKRSVLRQNSAKVNRRHAPSGRITAFDDEDDEDAPMPSGEELAKIKLPTSLFPEHFSFEEQAEKPTLEPKPLLERMAPPATATSTTPAKEPPSGAVRFEARREAEEEAPKQTAPPNLFFASAPTKSDSLSMEKKSGPVPDFFGTKKAAPATDSVDAKEKAADAPVEKPSVKKRDRGEEEQPQKKHTSTLNPTAPSFSFAKNDDKQAPTASFFPSKTAESKPTFSFGTQPEKKETSSSFFSAPPVTKKDLPSAFTFGQTKPDSASAPPASNDKVEAPAQDSETPKAAPAVSFGPSATAGADAPPSFSFGTASGSSTTKPSFSFATTSDTTKPSFSFATASDTTKPSFSFATASDTKKPSFSFAAPTEKKENVPVEPTTEKKDDAVSSPQGHVQASQPAFSFGQPAKTDAKPTFSFGTGTQQESEKQEEKASGSSATEEKNTTSLFGSTETKAPTFSFGQTASAATSAPAEKKNTPIFSFGQTAEKKESKPAPTFSFGQPAASKSDTPSFSLGQSQMKEDKPSSSFSFGTSSSKTDAQPTPTFGFGTSSQPAPFGTTPQKDTVAEPTAPSASTVPNMFGASAPASNSGTASPAPVFSFGTPAASSSNSAVGPAQPSFSFGAAAPAPAPVASTPSFGQPAGPIPSTTSFSFGSPNPSFAIGANSANANNMAPTTSFSFKSAPPSGVFQFGAPQPTAGAPGAPAPAPSTSFSFGSGSAPAPSFTFGAMPASPAPGSPAPGFSFGTPPPNSGDGSGGMFNLGSSSTPSGRQIKPLRQSRRRN